jgi:enoyl-CoA hydratase
LEEKTGKDFMNTENEHVKIENKENTGYVILKGHGALNLLNTITLNELGTCLTELENDEQIRAIIIAGEKNFCAGADVKEMKDKHPMEAEVFSRLGHKIFSQIEDMDKPVIAAINGYALGGGCELALACDIRIAGESAKFGQPEVNLGLIPGFGGTQRLAGLVGIGKAKELILTGRIIDAKEAESIGLVNNVVKNDELIEESEKIAQLIAEKSPVAIKMAKNLINKTREINRGLEMEMVSFSMCFSSQDHVEGINAFLEKRKPGFRGI